MMRRYPGVSEVDMEVNCWRCHKLRPNTVFIDGHCMECIQEMMTFYYSKNKS